MTPRGKAATVFVVLAALAGLETCRLGNPEPAPESAPPEQFSAGRALAAQQAVFTDEPHPLGTPAHDAVRDRVVEALRKLDYAVEIQHAFACNASAYCGTVDNVIARRPDQPAGKAAVVVCAHYDSVPAGPGASDDGTGVATALEIARAIRREALANPVVFLIDDGEEAGLLGAEGYLADAARGRDAAFVVNLEARGTSGTPYLFETSREQRWLVPIVAGALPHPVTSSLFATVYDQLPNDTDLTVFKRAGRAGINFAYIGDATQYHTPLDSFADVDPGGVQRRGEQVLAMVRAFGAARLGEAAPGAAVWFDAFAAFVVWWPASWTAWIAGLAFALLAVALVRGARAGRLTLGGAALGVASFVAAVALGAVLGVALGRLFGLEAPGALFEPHPGPKVAAAWLVGIAAALAVAAVARRRASFDAIVVGQALGWNGAALAIGLVLPGASYLFVVPALVMAVVAAARSWRPGGERGELAAAIAGLVAAATVMLPFVVVGHDALGDASLTVTCVLLALIATAFAPLVSDTARRLVPGCVALAAVLGGVGAVVPRTSASHPRHEPIAYVRDADSGAARWQIDGPTPEVRAAASAAFAPSQVAPWRGSAGEIGVAPAPAEQIPPPDVSVTTAPGEGDTRTVTLEIASARHAPRLALLWHTGAETVAMRINGVAPPPRPARWRSSLAPGWNRILVRGSSARIELTLRGTAPAEAVVTDTSFGLPASGAALIRARNASGAVPVHDGDVTIVERHLRW